MPSRRSDREGVAMARTSRPSGIGKTTAVPEGRASPIFPDSKTGYTHSIINSIPNLSMQLSEQIGYSERKNYYIDLRRHFDKWTEFSRKEPSHAGLVSRKRALKFQSSIRLNVKISF